MENPKPEAVPYVVDEDGLRRLHYAPDCVQSTMSLADPYALELRYTREMTAFLLFDPAPQDLVILGLGGGSLAKFCHRELPDASITVVEIDPRVVALRKQFHVPPDDSRFEVIPGDAARFVANTPGGHDVMLADTYGREGLASSTQAVEYYTDIRASLAPHGLFVTNLAGSQATRYTHLETMSDVFGANLLLVPVEGEGNEVVVAFRDAAFEPDWKWLREFAPTLSERHKLDFPAIAGRLERSRRFGYAKRTLVARASKL